MTDTTQVKRSSHNSFKNLFTKASNSTLNKRTTLPSSLPVSVNRRHSASNYPPPYADVTPAKKFSISSSVRTSNTTPHVPKRTTSLYQPSETFLNKNAAMSRSTIPDSQSNDDSLQDIKATFERMKDYLASRDSLSSASSDLTTPKPSVLGSKHMAEKTQFNASNKGGITHHTSPTVESLAVTIEEPSVEEQSELDREYEALMDRQNLLPRSASTTVALNPSIIVDEPEVITPTPRSNNYSPLKMPDAQLEMETSTPTQCTNKRMSMPANLPSTQHHDERRSLTYPEGYSNLSRSRMSQQQQQRQLSSSSLCSAASMASPITNTMYGSPGLMTPSTSTTSIGGAGNGDTSLNLHRLSKQELFRLLVDTQSDFHALKSRYGLEKGALEDQLRDTLEEVDNLVEENEVQKQDLAKEKQYVAALRRALHRDNDGVVYELERSFNSIDELKSLVDRQQAVIDEQKDVINRYKSLDDSVRFPNNTNIQTNKSNLLGDVTAPFLQQSHPDDTSFISQQSDLIVDIDSTVHDENGKWTLGLDDDARRALDA
ncbi:hypothetical protein E3Q14_03761 [Wallemia mellicola]|nr:hypothetical protein E3Q14_03761 [Wallemia mellicola]